jgi:hypothetical protein
VVLVAPTGSGDDRCERDGERPAAAWARAMNAAREPRWGGVTRRFGYTSTGVIRDVEGVRRYI